ncbi:MAG: 50S ribosomal protein L21 [Nitrospirae bacterium RBG_19FT_COMBO_55_12]|nr:MAG: 50S ribosomal protein L21 [Nitrospirae bacterium RBG_19FT_COMBO_55_12]
MDTYAVIHTGGKQYRVSPGDVVRVEKLLAQTGEKIEIDRVYLLAHDGGIFAGNPVLKSTRVVAQVLDQDRGRKIIIFKHRRRKGYRKTIGHRQAFTELKILEIIHEGASYQEQPEKQKQLNKSAVAAAAPPVKKTDAAKQQAAPKKKPEKQVAAAPREPEKPKPAEQRVTPEAAPVVSAAEPERAPIAEPVVPAAPLPEPERSLPPANPLVEAKPLPIGREEKPSTDRRIPWWIIGAIIAALTLLGLLLFNGRNRPSPGPETRQETGIKPAPEKQEKAKPVVRDVKIKKTAPVDKPAAPAQPPD